MQTEIDTFQENSTCSLWAREEIRVTVKAGRDFPAILVHLSHVSPPPLQLVVPNQDAV